MAMVQQASELHSLIEKCHGEPGLIPSLLVRGVPEYPAVTPARGSEQRFLELTGQPRQTARVPVVNPLLGSLPTPEMPAT